MIKKNRQKIYSELKTSLQRERVFNESRQRESILDKILKNLENLDIYYIFSNKASNNIRFFGEDAVIIWDMKYWQYFEEYLMQVYNCRKLNISNIQGIICVISGFLSEKYKNINNISLFLGQIKSTFQVKLKYSQEYYKEVYNIMYISKLFSFFHEVGHLEYYKKNNIEIKACQELALTLFNAIKDNKLNYLGAWAELGQQTISSILFKKSEVEKAMLEELIADMYAIINTVKLYKKLRNTNEFQAICNCMIGEEYISTFQNMFTAINKAWDAHYVEMKFGLPVKTRAADTYINELAIIRNGIGSLMLVFVVKKIFHLDNVHCNLLLEYIDKNHIDNEGVISCLADDEFICTAVEEAFY